MSAAFRHSSQFIDVSAGFRDALLPDRMFDDLLAERGTRDSHFTIFPGASALPIVRMQ
jgi:hypothetical protein